MHLSPIADTHIDAQNVVASISSPSSKQFHLQTHRIAIFERWSRQLVLRVEQELTTYIQPIKSDGKAARYWRPNPRECLLKAVIDFRAPSKLSELRYNLNVWEGLGAEVYRIAAWIKLLLARRTSAGQSYD